MISRKDFIFKKKPSNLKYQFAFEIGSDVWTRFAIDNYGCHWWLPMIPTNQNRYLLVPY